MKHFVLLANQMNPLYAMGTLKDLTKRLNVLNLEYGRTNCENSKEIKNKKRNIAIFTVYRAENGLLGPITGWLMDKFGPMPIALIGTEMAGTGYILLSRAENYTQFLLIYVIIVSIGATTNDVIGCM